MKGSLLKEAKDLTHRLPFIIQRKQEGKREKLGGAGGVMPYKMQCITKLTV